MRAAKHSTHEGALSSAEGFRSTQSEDASTAGGELTQTIDATTLHLSSVSKLIGSKFWLKGDQLSLQNSLGMAQLQAGLDAGYWIPVKTTSKYYEPLVFGLNFTTSLTGIALGPPFSVSGPARDDGISAFAISSRLALHLGTSSGPQKGTFTLYVSATSNPLPIIEVAHFTVSGAPESVTVTFSRWGEPVVLRPPAGPRPV